MNEHAGASCALSVLIVAVFAVLLHDRNPTATHPALHRAEAPASADSPPPPPAQPRPLPEPPRPRPQPPQPVITASTPALPASTVPQPSTRAAALPTQPPIAEIPQVDRRPSPPAPIAVVSHQPVAAPAPAPARREPIRPASSFAEVGPGETLADVANRVYGTVDVLDALWKANRDQLARRDSPLPRGTLLRTP